MRKEVGEVRLKAGILIFFLLLCLVGTASAWVDSDGYKYDRYLKFLLAAPITGHTQYEIVINGQTIEVYNATGSLEIIGDSGHFWDYVQQTGDDVRVFNQSSQLYYWIRKFDYENRTAEIWVNLTKGSSELNLAYGNPIARKSSYENASEVFRVFKDFEDGTTQGLNVIAGIFDVALDDTYVLKQIESNGNRRGYWPDTFSLNAFVLHARVKNIDGIGGSFIYLRDSSAAAGWIVGFGLNAIAVYGRTDSAGAVGSDISKTHTFNKNEWYDMKIIYRGSGTIRVEIDGDYFEATRSESYNIDNIGVWCGYTVSWDDIFVTQIDDFADFVSVTEIIETGNNKTYINVPEFFIKVPKPMFIFFDLPIGKQDRAELLLPTASKGYETYIFWLSNTTDKEDLYAIIYELNATEIKAHLIPYNTKTEYGQFYVENDLTAGKSTLVFIPGEKLAANKFKIRLISHPVWWEKILWKLGFLPKLEVN